MANLLFTYGTLLWVAPLCLLGHSDPVAEEAPYVAASLNRLENFALTKGAGGLNSEVLGLVEWRERIVEGGRVLERDVFFGGNELTVRHVERLTTDTQRLVWREAATGVGRSQIVEPAEGDLLVVDWLRTGLDRTELECRPDTLFPLALLEALRDGEPLPDRVSRYWPLTRSIEELEVETRLLDGTPGTMRRLVELRRGDQSLAGRFLFDGDALESFQWQEGGPWARRVSRERYRLLMTQLIGEDPLEPATEAQQTTDW